MEAATRTPEGAPQRCPVCATEVCIEPSTPPGDAPCPFCGHLLWFAPAPAKPALPPAVATKPAAAVVSPSPAAPPPPATPTIGVYDVIVWVLYTGFGAVVIAVVDTSLVAALLWSAGSLVFGCWGVPYLVGLTDRLNHTRRSFFLNVICSWGLGAGPLVGSFLGLGAAWLCDWQGYALVAGMLGLLLGPFAAALEGLLVVGVLLLVMRLCTGQWLQRL